MAAWRLRGIQTRRGEGRQAEREVAWRGGARARRARARPPVGEEDDRGGGQVGWAGQLGRPGRTVLGQTAAGKRQVGFPISFSFLFSDICFDLIKILNHFILFCKF